MPVSYLFSNLLISRGRSVAYMWCTIALCLAQLLGVTLCVPYGIGRMVIVFVILNICWVGVWFWFSHNEIGLTVGEAIRDVAPYVLLASAAVIGAHFATSSITNIYAALAAKVLIVGISYCAALWLLGSTIFKETVLFLTKKKIE